MEMAPQAKICSTQRSKTIGKVVGILTKKYIIMENSPCFAPFENKGGFSNQFPLMSKKTLLCVY